ncbi:MAG: folate-binding protein [Pseudomonadota bacterium]
MMDRAIVRLAGEDHVDFLQGLITNDMARLGGGILYAALLTPQGKYLADFFVVADGDGVLLDVAEPLADDLIKRLTMYRLRAKVSVEKTDLRVLVGEGDAPDGAHIDPRHPALGWRLYGSECGQFDSYDDRRIEHLVPQSLQELIPNDSFILEMNFEELNGVDFKKGCYVGQEVTARMKHKTSLRKGLARVAVSGDAVPGTEIMADGKPAGQLFTRSGDEALAYLRFDRAEGQMSAGDALVTRL